MRRGRHGAACMGRRGSIISLLVTKPMETPCCVDLALAWFIRHGQGSHPSRYPECQHRPTLPLTAGMCMIPFDTPVPRSLRIVHLWSLLLLVSAGRATLSGMPP
eukprot:668007-Amphidinium_carterae.1